ncbi:MAG TPA: HAD family phosphatase [Bacteriovoracaceae bacterium]|nr:HAD family phosphatase [Bacteriovoracaceae bacterium]
MIKYVLSDYAGVISYPQDKDDINEMAGICGVSLSAFESAYWKHREAYDQGKLTGQEYWKRSFPELDLIPGKINQLIKIDSESWSHLNAETQEWLEEIKSTGVRLALFSNMPPELTQYLKINIPWLKIFEKSFYSCELGLCKPHAASFQAVLKGLKQNADEVLFVDDREDNIEGAKSVGLKTMLFKDVATSRKEYLHV